MRVLDVGIYRGPHRYSATPMVRIRIDLGELEALPTDRIPGFSERLLCTLPGLGEHRCSLGRPGGFLDRLRDGTWLGHVVEHVALELQALAGGAATRGKTRSVPGAPGVYDVCFAYDDREVGLAAGALALRLVHDLLPPPTATSTPVASPSRPRPSRMSPSPVSGRCVGSPPSDGSAQRRRASSTPPDAAASRCTDRIARAWCDSATGPRSDASAQA